MGRGEGGWSDECQARMLHSNAVSLPDFYSKWTVLVDVRRLMFFAAGGGGKMAGVPFTSSRCQPLNIPTISRNVRSTRAAPPFVVVLSEVILVFTPRNTESRCGVSVSITKAPFLHLPACPRPTMRTWPSRSPILTYTRKGPRARRRTLESLVRAASISRSRSSPSLPSSEHSQAHPLRGRDRFHPPPFLNSPASLLPPLVLKFGRWSSPPLVSTAKRPWSLIPTFPLSAHSPRLLTFSPLSSPFSLPSSSFLSAQTKEPRERWTESTTPPPSRSSGTS